MLRVALTGGIGSGKSLVARLFSVLGVPVYQADDAAKRLMQSDPILKEGLIELFGPEVFDRSGNLQRQWMAKRLFGHAELVQAVNQLVHPAVYRDLRDWFNHQTYPYAIYESALVKANHRTEVVDRIVTVYAPQSIRIARVCERDQVAAHEVRRRMQRQPDAGAQILFADHLIINDGRALIPQVWKLHQLLIRQAHAPDQIR